MGVCLDTCLNRPVRLSALSHEPVYIHRVLSPALQYTLSIAGSQSILAEHGYNTFAKLDFDVTDWMDTILTKKKLTSYFNLIPGQLILFYFFQFFFLFFFSICFYLFNYYFLFCEVILSFFLSFIFLLKKFLEDGGVNC